MNRIKNRLRYSSFPLGIYILLLIIVGVFLAATQGSVSPTHLLNIARSAAPLGIVAMGQTIVLIAGGLDLSVGTTISMVNLVAASVMNGRSENILQAVLISLFFCVLIGLANGFIIVKFKMQPFLVTMAMSFVIQGCYYLYTQGIARGSIAKSMRVISEGWIGPIPIAVMIWGAFWLVLSVVLHKTVTVYGRGECEDSQAFRIPCGWNCDRGLCGGGGPGRSGRTDAFRIYRSRFCGYWK